MSPLWLSRARLRRDANLDALAQVLLPDDADRRVSMAHRLVWTMFADGAERRRDFLWREDQPGRFMLLSARPPLPGVLFDLDSKPFAPILHPGDRLGFSLRANPTIAHAVPGHTARSRRSDVVMDALKPIPNVQRAGARADLIQQEGAAWLGRLGARHGFVAITVHADGYRRHRLERAGSRPISLSTLDLQGTLTVQDPPLFLAALAAGFGRARAFGCGLMLIRRAA